MDDDDFDFSPAVTSRALGKSTSYEKLRENLTNQGYRTGLHKGEDETVQKGFQQGLWSLSTLGLRVGNLRGKAQAAMVLLRKVKRKQEEDELKKFLEKMEQVWFVHEADLGELTEEWNGEEILAVKGREKMQVEDWKREGKRPEQVLDELNIELDQLLKGIPLNV